MGCASEHPSLHQAVQVFGVVGRRDYDDGTLTKASAKRDRRISKSTTTTTGGGKTVNKSCDTCSSKKRRCDGGRPCSRCVRRGDGHKCTYSTRRPYTSRNRRSRLWSSLPSSSGQTALGTASAASGRRCHKGSVDAHCRDSRDQRDVRHRPIASPADSTEHQENISRNLDLQYPRCIKRQRSVVEASPPAGPMVTPISECSSSAIEEVYAELARAQQGVMSLIVSTNSPPLEASNHGLEQQAIKQHPVQSVGNSCKLGADAVGFVETLPRTVSLEEESNPRGSVPGLEIGRPVLAPSAALVRDSSTDDDSDSSTLDLDVNIPSSLSDSATVVHDVPMISFDQHLPPMGEKIAITAAAAAAAAVYLDQTLSALGQDEQDIISAEDWFEFAAAL